MALTGLALYTGGLSLLLVQSIQKTGLGIALCILALLIGLQTALYIEKKLHNRPTFISWKFALGACSTLSILLALACLVAGELLAFGFLALLGMLGMMCFFGVAMSRK